MRNSNYYKSVIREFFPKDTEKHRNAFLSAEGLCNMCGDEIEKRAIEIADLKFV